MVRMAGNCEEIVVIGYGNSLRRDDGAGVRFAEAIVDAWRATGQPARLLTSVQLLPEMAEEFAGQAPAVVFVDASAELESASIRIAEVEPHSNQASLGHHLSPATLLVYAALLYGRSPRAWLVTIPGHDFAHGEGFSPPVSRLLDGASLVACDLLAVIKDSIPCMN
jgi:hydrogenase maturation protease